MGLFLLVICLAIGYFVVKKMEEPDWLRAVILLGLVLIVVLGFCHDFGWV